MKYQYLCMTSIFHNDAHFLLQEHCSIQEISFLAHPHFEQFTLDSADLGCLHVAIKSLSIFLSRSGAQSIAS